jgi:transcriptional regulator with XRE-family HTH domain
VRNTPESARGTWATYAAKARTDARMSQSDLARRLRIDRVTVWRWENRGQRPEDPAIVHLFAQTLGLDVDEVLAAAGLKLVASAPTQPTRQPDPELEAILLSGLPARVQQELIEYLEQRRGTERERRLEDLRRMIRLADGRNT